MSTSSLPSFIKIHPAVLEKKSKMWKVYGRTDGRTTDDGRCAMTIAHSSLRLRWAKNPTKSLWCWEPDRRSSFFFNPPAHLCAVAYMTEKSLIVTLNNRFTTPHILFISFKNICSSIISISLASDIKSCYFGHFWLTPKLKILLPLVVMEGCDVIACHQSSRKNLWTTGPQTNFTSPLYSLLGNFY